MRIAIVAPGSLSAQDRAEWRAMQDTCITLSNPFLSPEFAVAVGRVRPQALVAVMSDGDERVGYFPFERGRLRVGRPIGAGISDRQGVIHRPHATWDAHELLRACEIDTLEFDNLASGQTSFSPFVLRTEPAPFMDLSGGFDAYLERLRAGAKSAFRRYRKLERDFGDVCFEYDSQDESALTDMMRWKSAQYKRTGRYDRFGRHWIVDLIRDLHRENSDAAIGILSVLSVGGKPIAAHFGLRSDRVLAGWFPAYDPAFHNYSPGLVLFVLMAQAASEQGVEALDLAKGANEQKSRLKTGDLVVGEARISLRTPFAMAYHVRRAPARHLERFVLDHPRLRVTARRALLAAGAVRSRLDKITD